MGGPLKIRALRSVVKVVAGYQQKQIENVLARAIFDPEVADTMQLLASGVKTEVVMKRFANHITALGLKESTDAMVDESKRQKENVSGEMYDR